MQYDLRDLWTLWCASLEMCLPSYLWSVAFDVVFFPDVLIVEELGLSLPLSFTCVGVNVLCGISFFDVLYGVDEFLIDSLFFDVNLLGHKRFVLVAIGLLWLAERVLLRRLVLFGEVFWEGGVVLGCGATLRDGGVLLRPHTSAYDARREMRGVVRGLMLGRGAMVQRKCKLLARGADVLNEGVVMVFSVLVRFGDLVFSRGVAVRGLGVGV